MPAFDNLVAEGSARLRGPGPYKARSASDNTDDWPFWYVAGPDGRLNVLGFTDKSGAIFTDRESAERYAMTGNESDTSSLRWSANEGIVVF